MSSSASGRPVRFFIVLMGGWILVRLAIAASSMLQPPSLKPHAPFARFTPAAMASAGMKARKRGPSPRHGETHSSTIRLRSLVLTTPSRGSAANALTMRSRLTATQGHETAPFLPEPDASPRPASPPAVPLALVNQTISDRWHGSAWMLWREGSATSSTIVTAGRLGGSQAGLRLDYDLTPRAPGRAAVYGRVSTALNRPASPEGALGLSWQPSRTIPISIAAERRIALGKGGRNANALFAAGGFGPTPVLFTLEAEGYAQAGIVGFHRGDRFADGKLSLLSPLARTGLRMGASISGGAQPSAERLDMGPEVQIRLPLPRLATRLSLEWRERIAGNATPSSGFAVTLGADF